MDNNFEERRKDVDLSNIDIDAHSFQRKKLELDDKFAKKADTESSFYSKERELANNNDDEIIRRIKVSGIDKDFERSMGRLNEEYQKELKELEEKYERNYDRPSYYRLLYVGPVGKYSFPNGKTIHAVMNYYVKLDELDRLFVYNDAKFSDFLGQIDYIPEEWREEGSDGGSL